ncbi:3-deoxy-7-phosphoheptulonate synthase [bacterium]|nr:3-deoxy-7-phosphoheptulonate synthase [bacterium]
MRKSIIIGDVEIGGLRPIIIAGPCAVESREQVLEIADEISKLGIRIMRGGAFKPRTSPYSFQGLNEKGLEYLYEAKEKTGLLIQTEVMDTMDIELIARYADIIQIGTRNMQNFALLKAISLIEKPVFFKRGFMSTIKEFLLASEYLTKNNKNIILCERGIRTFEDETRFTLDLCAVPILKKMSPYPVFVDPSHATGRSDLILPMSKAAIMAGADGIMLEVHPNPQKALCDGLQAINLKDFKSILDEINDVIDFSVKTKMEK